MAVIGVGGLLSGVLAAGGAAGAARVTSATVKADTVIPISAGLGAGRAHNVSQLPTGLVAAKSGLVYVGDGQGFVRALTPGSRKESYVAGSLAGIESNGAAAVATLLNPDGGDGTSLSITADPAGDLVVADSDLDVVRVLAASSGTRFGVEMSKGRIYTVAGQLNDNNDGNGFTGAGGKATAATLSFPEALTTDGAGDLVIADTGDNEVQVVAASTGRHYGRSMTVGHIYTVAGDGKEGTVISGTKAAASPLDQPDGLAVTPLGLAIASAGSNQVPVLATKTGHEYGVSMPKALDLYVVVNKHGTSGAGGDGRAATAADLDGPGGLAVDRAGDLFVADSDNHEVRAVAADTHAIFGAAAQKGDIYTVAGSASGSSGDSGNNGLAISAKLSFPFAVAVDASGNLLLGDLGTANVDLVAAKTVKNYGQKTTADHLYYIAGNGLYLSSGYDAPAVEAENNEPIYNAVAPDGDIAYADLGFLGQADGPDRGAARSQAFQRYLLGRDAAGAESPKFSHPDGPGVEATRIRVIASKSGIDFGRKMIAGDDYTIGGGPVSDGDPPKGQLGGSYGFGGAVGVAYDHSDNVIVSDDFDGYIDVIAATSGSFYGQKMTAGHVYHLGGTGVADSVRPKDPVGTPAIDADIIGPGPVAVDKGGNIVISELGVSGDSPEDSIVAVIAARTGTYYQQTMTAGDIYTIAGDGTDGDTGDGSPATAAEIEAPYGLAIDSAGNVAITSAITGDSEVSTVRFIAESAGTYFGQAMTVGDIYTLAGTSAPPVTGYGNGGPARAATLGGPGGLAFTADGSLIVGDVGNAEIRLIAASHGTRFGIGMTADDIYAIAGNGQFGRTGYAVKGTSTSVDEVFGLSVASTGNVVFDDEFQGAFAGLTNK